VNPLNEYLCGQLNDLLEKRRVVVFYDPKSEFAPLFDLELENVGAGPDGLYCVFVGERRTLVARYEGSLFAVRAAVESTVAPDTPDSLLIYMPGAKRDSHESVLMELEKGGATYEPQLKRHARTVLRRFYTDGVIDEMIDRDGLTYDDVVSYLAQASGGEHASILKTIFGGASSEALLTLWLAESVHDEQIVEKGASDEVFGLVHARLGLALPAEISVGDARSRTIRYVLVNEFRSDLDCDPPDSLALIESTTTKEEIARVHEIAEALRRHEHAERYIELADQVEKDLNVAGADIDAANLGATDTFRFEERSLLKRAVELASAGGYDQAIQIAVSRAHSFWLDRDVTRQAQWEACRLAAELGRAVVRIEAELGNPPRDGADWVAAYKNGWFEVDRLQRRLEAWIAQLDDEPEAERAIAVGRLAHEELLKRMAIGFAKALDAAGWSIAGVLPQTSIYPECVQSVGGGGVAYVLVDALRYEMGVELGDQLQGAEELTVRPAIAMLPTITPVGMAALLPGASASFSVVENKGKLAARIDQTVMPGWAERVKYLKARVPDVVDLPLDKVLSTSATRLKTTVGDASLILVRSQEIDFAGELDAGGLARHVMDSVIGNIARAVRKLAAVGIESFVVTADHGHQFAMRKEEDMKIDAPGGDTVALHRRCWAGRGGATPPGTVRVSAAELGYDSDLDFVFATSLGVFKAGGGLTYHHGGVSLQEMVIPVLTFRIPPRAEPASAGGMVHLEDVPDQLTNRAFSVRITLAVLTTEPMALRVVLLSGSEQVGQAGMVVGADLDRETGIVTVQPGTEASVGVMLTRDDCETVRLVVLDPTTDAVLGQSSEIPVMLGI
jgi:hypothetical protein